MESSNFSDINSLKREMSFHVGELSQYSQQEITKLGNFMNCQNFSPKIQKFPKIPAGNF